MLFKPLDGIVLFFLFEFGFLDCFMERLDGAIIGRSIYRERCAILSAVGKAELGWVFPAWACSIYEFGYQSQSPDSFWPQSF